MSESKADLSKLTEPQRRMLRRAGRGSKSGDRAYAFIGPGQNKTAVALADAGFGWISYGDGYDAKFCVNDEGRKAAEQLG